MTMGTRVYVGRISYDVRERDIEKFFKGYGRIREILMKDGFAFVVSNKKLIIFPPRDLAICYLIREREKHL